MQINDSILHLENQLCFPLYAASRLTTQLYGPILKELNITYPQYLVLLVLWQKGNQTVNEICQSLYLESNTITPLLKRLEEKGIITRSRSQKDERIVNISLTENGISLKNKALEIPEQIYCSINQVGDITENEILQFQKTLFKIINVLNNKTEIK